MVLKVTNDFIVFFKFLIISIAGFAVFHILHFRLFSPQIVLKASIIDSVIGPLIPCLVFSYYYNQYYFINFSVYTTTVLIAIIYSILVPTMVDRSISVYMLLYLDESPSKELNFDELNTKLQASSILHKRFIEHEEAGSIELKGNKVLLTTKGQVAAKIFLFNKNILNLKRNY